MPPDRTAVRSSVYLFIGVLLFMAAFASPWFLLTVVFGGGAGAMFVCAGWEGELFDAHRDPS